MEAEDNGRLRAGTGEGDMGTERTNLTRIHG